MMEAIWFQSECLQQRQILQFDQGRSVKATIPMIFMSSEDSEPSKYPSGLRIILSKIGFCKEFLRNVPFVEEGK